MISARKVGGKSSQWDDTNNSGFTLIEVLIATLILVAAIVPLMTAFIHGARWTAESRDLITAVNLAQGKLEELKNRPYASLESGEPVDPNQPPRPFTGYPEYTYRLAVIENDEKNLKTITIKIYEAATGKEVVSLTMDRGDWK
ncbi:type IV pilus modification PilV family protein [Thermosediminibacter litoriperuensis]|uniref:Prepilin-type N-terminal cleavage/methylation domain-containing protein n=1 Tax=Thermosediminibacter litoriperuensis TaxID=291989 RepID=A0A5S5AR57_9FIRM|nr:prepilin-type N-terminal cleavage/methylation domain-containing protein [Thermosediminibacter litoriperuensis]TYP53295.1 prepilin-type N-terminal cleavage/methylation domain-containing protein [Thermosediminibacter litoriperuensis]